MPSTKKNIKVRFFYMVRIERERQKVKKVIISNFNFSEKIQ